MPPSNPWLHLLRLHAGVPPVWLKSPSLPRSFVLELLDFVLTNSPAVFRELAPFQSALAARMPQLIQAQLQDHLDAGAASASFAINNFTTFKALLRLMRTLLRSFYTLLDTRSGALVQALLAGVSLGMSVRVLPPPAFSVAYALSGTWPYPSTPLPVNTPLHTLP